MGIYKQNMQKQSIYVHEDPICMPICWNLETFAL
jgi:hypothetical protein